MLAMVGELIRHKWWANDNLLRAVAQHDTSRKDEELRKVLHHILIANRYWLLLALGETWDDAKERPVPESIEALIERFRQTETAEMDWLAKLSEAGLEQHLQPRALPGVTVSVAQVVMQVCLHSHGHRSQCATRLRALGGTPAPMDFVLWVMERTGS
jgi:uncharacterized damage-inducible protein DinB